MFTGKKKIISYKIFYDNNKHDLHGSWYTLDMKNYRKLNKTIFNTTNHVTDFRAEKIKSQRLYACFKSIG